MPARFATRPRVDTRQRDLVLLEHGQAVRQRARSPMLRDRERDQSLVHVPLDRLVDERTHVERSRLARAADNEEARRVLARVLDVRREDREPVFLRRQRGADGCGVRVGRVGGHESGAARRRRHVLLLGVLEVGAEELLALAPCLRVRVEFGDVAPVSSCGWWRGGRVADDAVVDTDVGLVDDDDVAILAREVREEVEGKKLRSHCWSSRKEPRLARPSRRPQRRRHPRWRSQGEG